MNFKKIGRLLVCLVLVCCLIVNVSPIRAKATGAEAAAFTIAPLPAKLVIATALVGCGIMAGVSADALDGVVNGAVYDESLGEYAINGLIDVVKTTHPDGTVEWLFPLAFLEDLRDWLFGSKTLVTIPSEVLTIPAGQYIYSSSDEKEWVYFDALCYGFLYTRGGYGTYRVVFNPVKDSAMTSKNSSGTTQTFSVNSTTGYAISVRTNLSDDCIAYYQALGWPLVSGTSQYTSVVSQVMSGKFGLVTSTSEDLTLGEVGTSDQSVEEAYPSWTAGAVTVPGTVTGSGSDDKYVPVGLPADYNTALGATQDEVQSGESSYVDTETDTEVGEDTEEKTVLVYLSDIYDTLVEGFKNILEFLTTILTDIYTGLTEGVIASLEAIVTTCTEIGTGLKEGVITSLQTLVATCADIWTGIKDGVIGGITTLAGLLEQILEAIYAGILSLIDGITLALTNLFAISDTYLAAKVAALTAKYPYLDTFLALGNDLKAYFSGLGTKPPIIYIDLGAASFLAPLGGRVVFMDLTWYSAYKPTMDAILGAFIWLWLAWRVFLTLPSIINGTSGVVGTALHYQERSSKSHVGGINK